MLKARCLNYTLCPACDRSVDAPITKSKDMTASAAGQERPFVSTDCLRGFYTDDVESQLLLSESSLVVMGNQTTGIVTND